MKAESGKVKHRIMPEIPGFKSDRLFAAELGRNTKTTWRWRKRGIGPTPTMIGRDVYYSDADVAAWLEKCRKPAAAPRRRGRPRKVKAAA